MGVSVLPCQKLPGFAVRRAFAALAASPDIGLIDESDAGEAGSSSEDSGYPTLNFAPFRCAPGCTDARRDDFSEELRPRGLALRCRAAFARGELLLPALRAKSGTSRMLADRDKSSALKYVFWPIPAPPYGVLTL